MLMVRQVYNACFTEKHLFCKNSCYSLLYETNPLVFSMAIMPCICAQNFKDWSSIRHGKRAIKRKHFCLIPDQTALLHHLPRTVLHSLQNAMQETNTTSMGISSKERNPAESGLVMSRVDAEQIFNAVDIDSSGYLTAAKVRHFMGKIGIYLNDREMSEMIKMVDVSGTGQIDSNQFPSVLREMGFLVMQQKETKVIELEPMSEEESEMLSVEIGSDSDIVPLISIDERLRETLRLFDKFNSGSIRLSDIRKAAEQGPSSQPPSEMPNVSRGLGPFIGKANHIALIVSDVGKSAKFYAEVLGFKQVPRPNFDEHGAWFTMGNLELHLIKGIPIVHSGDDLIVGHISLETEHIEKIPGMLKKLGVPFRQNVSVPAEADAGKLGTNTSNNNDKIVDQYFIRDPDGYYLEICNCQALEEYTHAETNTLRNVSENVQRLTVELMNRWSFRARDNVKNRRCVLAAIEKMGNQVEPIAKALGCIPSENADMDLLKAFVARSTVYGDICQGKSTERLESILKLAGNCAKSANNILSMNAQLEGVQTLQPPAFYEEGTEFVLPPTFLMTL